jgi:CheY-like chemotaxis protein
VTNIFVVDDNQLMRQQALRLLEQQDSWQVSGEAVNGKDAVAKYRDLLPDVTIMDFEMPEMNGLDAARAILKDYPSAAILMLSVHLPGQLAEKSASRAPALNPKCGACPTRSALYSAARRISLTKYSPAASICSRPCRLFLALALLSAGPAKWWNPGKATSTLPSMRPESH